MSQQLLKVRIITKITKYDPLQNTKNSKNMTLLLFFGQSTYDYVKLCKIFYVEASL